MIIYLIVFWVSVTCLLAVVFLNPVLLLLFQLIKNKNNYSSIGSKQQTKANISIILVVKGGLELIETKLKNFFELDFPCENKEFIVCSDGPNAELKEKILSLSKNRIKYISTDESKGKNSAINYAVKFSSGDILVFNDLDSYLKKDALINLLEPFDDDSIGGVCGQRVIGESENAMQNAQTKYISWDSKIKQIESKMGSVTSNDGKLYAIRRKYVELLPDAVTDDLFNCLSVVRARARFTFNPLAIAYIKLPSRSLSHEMKRRIRIVSGSLRGIFLNKCLLNPLKHGDYAIRLLVNKVFRRLIMVFLIMLFLSSCCLRSLNIFYCLLFYTQISFYILVAAVFCTVRYIPEHFFLKKLFTLVMYFCVGNLGALIGVLYFLTGKQIARWEPLKTDKTI